MPHAFSSMFLHLVFSTKDRLPYLREPDLRSELHRYLGGTAKSLKSPPAAIGGVEDHVHLLLVQSRDRSVSDLVWDLKRSSSLWIKEQPLGSAEFAWQKGYGTFSVSRSDVDFVIRYIANQEEHHRRFSYQDEFRKLLAVYGIEIDEEHAWE